MADAVTGPEMASSCGGAIPATDPTSGVLEGVAVPGLNDWAATATDTTASSRPPAMPTRRAQPIRQRVGAEPLRLPADAGRAPRRACSVWRGAARARLRGPLVFAIDVILAADQPRG